jgi:hypothetical protein
MTAILTAVAALTTFLRSAFLVGGVVLGVVALADWAVRTRRLNPFGGSTRFRMNRATRSSSASSGACSAPAAGRRPPRSGR